jgi:Tol biopolymer transport system component
MHDESGLLAVRSDDVTNLRQLVFISYPDGAITKISNDLNQYSAMTVSDSGEKIVTNRYERQSNIVITDENESGSDGIKLYACCPDTVSWISDKQIVFDAFADGKRSLWTMSVDGADQTKFFSTDTQDWSPSVSPDGQSVVFLSTRSGSKQIWKCDSNGGKPQQLTQLESDIDSPQYSSDGLYVYFSLLADNKWKIARIEAAGGEPQIVVDENVDLWDVSPDSKSIAYTYWPEDSERQNIAVNDIDTKELKYRFDISSRYLLHWTPDGRQLMYEQPDPNNTSLQMLMRQNVSPGSVRWSAVKVPLVNYFLDISPDGHRYAYVRGHLVSSAAMLVRK